MLEKIIVRVRNELVLEWIRKVLANHESPIQEIDTANSGNLSGNIRLGVIPVALSILTTAFHRAYPGVTISVRSMNFLEIDRGRERFDIEVGINYIGTAPTNGLRNYVLYNEGYYLLAPKNHPLAQRGSISWREAGELPLCLLTSAQLAQGCSTCRNTLPT